MLMNQTISKLNHMKFFGFIKGLEEQAISPNISELGFEERISLLVDREFADRENRKLDRLLRDAKLKVSACLEDLKMSGTRGLDRSVIASLSSFSWIEQRHNIIICGATGTGKTYLSCAFGNGACRKGFKTYYYRVPKLLEEIRISRLDGSYIRLMTKFSRTELLILDDWGLSPLTETESKDILEVIEECQGKCSVITAGQLPIENWHQAIANPTVADAILDRLVHNAYKFNLKGESMRKNSFPKKETISDTI